MTQARAAIQLRTQTTPVEITVPIGEFDLDLTLESGQCFRWQRLAARDYLGVAQGCALQVRQEGERLRVRYCGGVAPEDLGSFINRYFDLSGDYRAILRRMRRDKPFARIAPRRAGIHILLQEPFEVIISFIVSANNHIPRIRSIIERLCQRYGEPIHTPFGRRSRFPSPEALARAKLSDLRLKCGLGYRDAYVRSAARALADEPGFTSWNELPTEALRQRLLELDGVGEKVADCVLLFGFHRLEAFPVDTWIRRAMTELYFSGEALHPRQIQACAAKRFGPYAGVAQQYLFVGQRSALGRKAKATGQGRWPLISCGDGQADRSSRNLERR